MPPLSPEADTASRFEVLFRQHYVRVARVIGRIVRDQARAEEMAVDVFVKWRRHPAAHGDGAEGWLYRTAVRSALDAWRRERRWTRLQLVLASVTGSPRTPEVLHESERERQQVHATLARLRRRDAAALLLWSEDVPYVRDRRRACRPLVFGGQPPQAGPADIPERVRGQIWNAILKNSGCWRG